MENDCLEHGWVLTGYPFSKRDFEYLDCIYTPPNRVIFLECELTICKDRILNRKINVHTGSTTNIAEHPEAEKTKKLKPHPKDSKEFIDAEVNIFLNLFTTNNNENVIVIIFSYAHENI